MKNDFILQYRHGFIAATVFVLLFYVIILWQIEGQMNLWVVAVVFLDLSVVGFIFVAAQVLFEKSQRTLGSLIVTPLRDREYLLSKVITLTLLSIVLSVVMCLLLSVELNWLHFITGVTFTSILYILIGFVIISAMKSMNEFFMVTALFMTLFNVPLLSYFGLFDSWLWYILPTHASLLLLKASWMEIASGDLIYAYAYMTVTVIALYFLAKFAFYRNIIVKQGGQ